MSLGAATPAAQAFDPQAKTCGMVTAAQLTHIFGLKHVRLHQEHVPPALGATTCDFDLWKQGTFAQNTRRPTPNFAKGLLVQGTISTLTAPASDSKEDVAQGLARVYNPSTEFALQTFGADGAVGESRPEPSRLILRIGRWWNVADATSLQVELQVSQKAPFKSQLGQLGAILVPKYFS